MAKSMPDGPLLAAAMEGRIRLYFHDDRGGPMPLEVLISPLPVVMVIGDRDGASGPDGWCCARAAVQWAGEATYSRCWGWPREAFDLVLEAAMLTRRVLLVETTPELLPSWQRVTGEAVERVALAS